MCSWLLRRMLFRYVYLPSREGSEVCNLIKGSQRGRDSLHRGDNQQCCLSFPPCSSLCFPWGLVSKLLDPSQASIQFEEVMISLKIFLLSLLFELKDSFRTWQTPCQPSIWHFLVIDTGLEFCSRSYTNGYCQQAHFPEV